MQPILDFDADDNCCLNVTKMEAINSEDDIISSPIENFKDHYVLVPDVTSLKDATESRLYQEPVREPLRTEINLTFSLEKVTELIVLGKRMSAVVVDKLGFIGRNS